MASSTSNEPFSAPVACEEGHGWAVYHYAAVMYAEARGESREGKLSVMDGVRNGAHGYKEGKLTRELVELAAGEIGKPVRHPYRHWINFDLATDKRQIAIARRALDSGKFLKVGNHFFY